MAPRNGDTDSTIYVNGRVQREVQSNRLALTLVVAALLVYGLSCAPTPPEGGSNQEVTQTSSAAVTTWKLQALTTPAMRYHDVVIRIAERVKEMSGGALLIEVYPTGAIVDAGEEFGGVDKNIIDACLAGHMNQLGQYPAAGLFYQIVGGMTAAQMHLWYLAGGGDELASRMYASSNCHYVNTPLLHPPEIWCHSAIPLRTVSDLEALRIRVAGDASEILAMMGAATVTFPAIDIYESVSRGIINAFEYGEPAINWGMGFHEIADYLYLSPSRAPTGGSGLFVGEESWSRVSPELRAMVKYAAMAETRHWYAEQLVLNDGALQRYVEYGTQVAPLPQAIEEEFLSTAESFYNSKAEGDPFFNEVLQSQRAFKELCEFQDVR